MTAEEHDVGVAGSSSGGRLRRELRVWEALALSIGLMSPALAMSASGGGAAGLVGQSVPLAFVGAGLVIGLVAYSFVYLSRKYAHAGSVYGFTGVTLGARAGFVSGWALLLTYAVFTPSSAFAFGGFLAQFLDSAGIWHDAPYLPLSLVGLALIWFFTAGDIRKLSRGLLTIEGASVLLILVVMVAVVVKITQGSAPDGATFSASVFTPSDGVTLHQLSLGVVFGFLAFAGFEGAASLGEETENPRRSIPRALRVTVVGGIIFYVSCMAVQTWAFGASATGAAKFAASGGPLFDIGSTYLSNGVGSALELGAAVSAFGSALGSAAGGARLLFAVSRDGAPSNALSRVSLRTGAPTNALAVLMLLAFVVVTAVSVKAPDPLTAWGWVGTVGVLALIVAYLMVNVGALRQMARDGSGGAVRYALRAVPVVSIAALAFILYNQVHPVPDAPFNYFPYVVLAWLAVGVVLAFAAPGRAQRIGQSLARQEGLMLDRTSPASAEVGSAPDDGILDPTTRV